ncbi:MAG: DUF4956 domain-containing protein [Planctomycetota bacterium]
MPELSGVVEQFLGNGSASGGGRELLASLLIAAFIGLGVAWVYLKTHHGLSYSRGFTQSLVVLTMAAALLIFVIGDSLVTAFGLLGALAIVRFRNVLKDTRDTVFVFLALVLGMAVGTQRHVVAIIGATLLLGMSAYLHFMSFGSKGDFDGHVTFALDREDGRSELRGALEQVEHVLQVFCRRVQRMSAHDSNEGLEVVSAVRLRDPARGDEMVHHLRGMPGVREAGLVLSDRYAEL